MNHIPFPEIQQFRNTIRTVRERAERLDSFVDAIVGKRITYAQLTKGKTWFDAGVA